MADSCEFRCKTRAALGVIASTLLDETASADRLNRAAAELYELLSSIAPVSDAPATPLPSGTALSPALAAMCTRDGKRTAVFLRAVRDAIRTFPGEAEVVYAGTGPFAPLTIPLMTLLAPGEARFTLIDVHESSIRSVERLVRHFGFGGFVRAAVAADATSYHHPLPIDVAVAEVMQRALTVEPQVEIVRNLAAQLASGGILIPERVTVELMLGEVSLGTVAELTAAVDLSPRTLTIPSTPATPSLATTIQAFGRHVLREGDSGLTAREMLWDLQAGTATFFYDLAPRPRLRWQLANAGHSSDEETVCPTTTPTTTQTSPRRTT